MFEEVIDDKRFEAYIEHILGPSRRPGDVIMDNLCSHKSKVAREIIRSKDAEYVFPPAYNPDLHSIEKMWTKVKQVLRGLKARTNEELYMPVAKKRGEESSDGIYRWI